MRELVLVRLSPVTADLMRLRVICVLTSALDGDCPGAGYMERRKLCK